MTEMPSATKPSMTLKQVQDFIFLTGQRKERWFEIRFVDKDMNKEPEAIKLMNALSDMVQEGLEAEMMSEHFEYAKKINTGGSSGAN